MMNNMKNSSPLCEPTYIRCSCSCHALSLEKDSDETIPMWYLSFWDRGHDQGLKWSFRLQHIWNIIKKGHPWADDLVFEKEQMEQLRDYLNKQLDRPVEPIPPHKKLNKPIYLKEGAVFENAKALSGKVV